jgi:hypothetical protein
MLLLRKNCYENLSFSDLEDSARERQEWCHSTAGYAGTKLLIQEQLISQRKINWRLYVQSIDRYESYIQKVRGE